MTLRLAPSNAAMKEEVREHRLETTSLVPGRSDLGRRRLSPARDPAQVPTVLPTVLVDSDEKLRDRKNTKSCLRKYCVKIVFLAGILFLVDFLDDLLLSPPNWGAPPDAFPIRLTRDYATVEGLDDLSSEFVDPWCFRGRPTCGCRDPMFPSGRSEFKQWEHMHHLNVENAKSQNGDVDVVFLGDSITEGWHGTSYGRKSPRAKGAPEVFKSFFSAEDGGKYQGLALGISGDTSPNLLWRIQNGELPDRLNPPVIWLLIGTNDFGKDWCSTELVVIGILRVVEELLLRKPGSVIVINSLLPRSFDRRGFVANGRHGRWWSSTAQSALPSLWENIEAVNEELKNYATNRPKVEYMDTTSLFLKDVSVPEEKLQIDEKLMPDHLHPSEKGYKVWGEHIVRTLDRLIPER